MSDRVDVVEASPVKKNKPIVVTGFTGPGFIGNTALLYLVRQKKFPLKAQIKSHLIPPMLLLLEGRPTSVFRIYSDYDDKILFIISEALITAENAWPIGLKIMEWLLEKDVKEFVSIEGMPFAIPGVESPIFAYNSLGKDMSEYGLRSTIEGGISGINAVLLEEALKYNIPWTTLMVPTNQAQAIDYSGSADILDVLNKMYDFDLDTTPLRQGESLRRRASDRIRKDDQKGLFGGFRRRRSNLSV